ncbi:uncharacterized protein B0I36DRAFT_328593 [Microdochium trichocladiopsis]|uniref:Ubiquitin 3 binding protein But2 C-terminal domain-containing protein n=1 Tax=Microdochium trichocladiopsis TaxID=1682393 RepID=A0A9P9BP23_9PEZI|nr:uncharacterized protein B0I36DRAFT_328593 [Microdochium trichocladiopsis]KAH7028089.1 hypothetical protein B0I36DRAFT_328593 [Microdochium trichocladiopsis]
MKSTITFTALAAVAAVAFAKPLEPRDAAQVAHLTFHAAPVSYDLSVPADGTVVETNSDLNINLIDAPDYNALGQCTFTFDSITQPALALHITESGLQQIAVGPPSVLKSVSCLGACVPTYGACYGPDGQYVGPCCTGFCAASRCRPWDLSV